MSRTDARPLRATGLIALLLIGGCGDCPSWNNHVEGTVRLDGVPLGGVRVEFVPDLGAGRRAPSSSASTDEKGHFQLTCGNNKPGAAVGRHRVVVIQGRGDARTDDPGRQPTSAARVRGPKVPRVYAIAAQTPLRVDVTPDSHTYDLTLTRTPQAAP